MYTFHPPPTPCIPLSTCEKKYFAQIFLNSTYFLHIFSDFDKFPIVFPNITYFNLFFWLFFQNSMFPQNPPSISVYFPHPLRRRLKIYTPVEKHFFSIEEYFLQFNFLIWRLRITAFAVFLIQIVTYDDRDLCYNYIYIFIQYDSWLFLKPKQCRCQALGTKLVRLDCNSM